MNIDLTPQLEEMIRQKVESGQYASVSEVVCDALRLMDETEQSITTRLSQLQRDLQEGLDSGPAVAWDPADIKQAGRAKRKAAYDGEP